MRLNLEVPKVYQPVFSDFNDNYCKRNLWYSPRTSWKSSGLGRIMLLYYLLYPDYDVCIGVDSLTNAGEGVLSEFLSYLESEGLNSNNEWVLANKSISKKGHKNQIRVYSVQTNERNNVNTTKGKKLIRPISLFIMDEVQKLHSKQILLNCLSTFLRQMKAGHSKVILAGNPDRRSMWFTEFYKAKLLDEEWTVLSPTYLDIVEWIPQALLHEIQDLQKNDPISYKQIYLGDLEVAGWEQVFHSFTSKHYVPRSQLIKFDREVMGYGAIIHSIIIGIDDAESNDAIAASCITVHKNGMLRVQESLYVSCKELPVKPALTERCAMIIEYLDYIQEHFNMDREIQVILSIDCASGLTAQLKVIAGSDKNHRRWKNVKIFKYSDKQGKEQQLDIMNAAIANGTLTVVNVNKYSPQYSNDKLVQEMHELRLQENGKIDPNIPNDATDALQYGVMIVLRNPYNLTFPQRKREYEENKNIDVLLQKLQERDRTSF